MDGLEVREVAFAAGEKEILKGVSFEVAPGETLALLGPSGCGKTTLLRVVAGLEPPTRGRVRFAGADVTAVPSHRRGFGMMFQDHALFPHLDTAQNIEFGLKRLGWERDRREHRVQELLELVGLPGFARRRIDKLSGGERQRVALARALAPEPKLLMLDEPLASLDRGLRERLAGELRTILERLSIPAIYVTHDQAEAFALADRVAIMRAGEILRTGTPREIWETPHTEFVARFLGLDNIVTGERNGAGLVRTPFGNFGPIPGLIGTVSLLLRPESVSLAEASGPNIAEGVVESLAFAGERTLLKLSAGGELVEFSLPSGAILPERGASACIAVPNVQALSDEAHSGAAD